MCHPLWVAPRTLVHITVTVGDCTLIVPFQHQQPYSHPSHPHITGAHWGFKTLSIMPIAVSVCCLIANWLSLKYGLFQVWHGCANINHSIHRSCLLKADGWETVADPWMTWLQCNIFQPNLQNECWHCTLLQTRDYLETLETLRTSPSTYLLLVPQTVTKCPRCR